MKSRTDLANTKLCVVKVGSAVLTCHGQGLNRDGISAWVDQIATLKEQGMDVVLVSSGSVAEGMLRLGWVKRPHALHELQAAASVGQMGLVQAYETSFQRRNMRTAQVLLTHDDLANRKRYLNARVTIRTLLDLGVVPIINENDVVANEELRFGDNDTLAALVANLLSANLLIILTDQAGFYDADPRTNPNAQLISETRVDAPELEQMAGSVSGSLGRGGMYTKLKAARLAARSGTVVVIASGMESEVISRVVSGEPVGTLLIPNVEPESARKRWLAGQLSVKGQVVLDEGAVKALKASGCSLLPVGVVEVRGRFQRGDLVTCIDANGQEVARGLINYSAKDVAQIRGQASSRIESFLGFVDEPELIHRDNMTLI